MNPLPAKKTAKEYELRPAAKALLAVFYAARRTKRLFRHDKRDTPLGVSLLIFFAYGR